MAKRRILAGLLLVVIMAGFLLPHWHKDWNEQGCQLCHVRNLPSLCSAIARDLALPMPAERGWAPDGPAAEVEFFLIKESSRAPPSLSPFTV
jgi:hypothetical protein